MENPIRSFTLESGLKNSSFSKTSACALCAAAVRFRRTRGVLPIVSVMSLYILDILRGGLRRRSKARGHPIAATNRGINVIQANGQRGNFAPPPVRRSQKLSLSPKQMPDLAALLKEKDKDQKESG